MEGMGRGVFVNRLWLLSRTSVLWSAATSKLNKMNCAPILSFCVVNGFWKLYSYFLNFFSTFFIVTKMGMMWLACANVQNHELYKDTSFQKWLKLVLSMLLKSWLIGELNASSEENKRWLFSKSAAAGEDSLAQLDQLSITASSWWSQQTREGENWLYGVAGPERSCNSCHNDTWRVCGRGFVFCGHSWHGT